MQRAAPHVGAALCFLLDGEAHRGWPPRKVKKVEAGERARSSRPPLSISPQTPAPAYAHPRFFNRNLRTPTPVTPPSLADPLAPKVSHGPPARSS